MPDSRSPASSASDEIASFDAIDAAARAAYARDGVIRLRGALEPRWLALTAAGIERNLRQPGRFFRDQTPADSPARYVFDYWCWPQIPEFEALIFDSPAAALVAELFDAPRVRLLMDNWFLREAGATNGAPWHHDEPYFDFFAGRKCIFWFPLQAVSAEEGLQFVAGSQAWGEVYMAQNFKQDQPFAAAEGYRPVPDIDARGEDFRLLGGAVAAGDALLFDFRSLHAASAGKRPLARSIQRMSLRFGDAGVRFRPRGSWTRETSDYLISLGQKVDAPVDCALLPELPVAHPRPDSRPV